MIKKYLIATVCLALGLMSCSDHTDDDKYRSDCPRFEAMSLSVEEVKVGETVTFTCEQRKSGKLLDRTTYTWNVEPAENVSCTPSAPTNGLYDGKNPTCDIVFPQAGTYTVTFNARYHGSGQVNYFEESSTLGDGTTARYSANTSSGDGLPNRDYLHATLTKRIRVVE